MHINNLFFAKNNEHLTGELLLIDLPRVLEWLQEKAIRSEEGWAPKGQVSYHLRGSENALKQAYLSLDLHVESTMICQRCLMEMPFKHSLHFNYLVVSDAKAQEESFSDASYELDDGDEIDILPASQSLDLVALIEDEVILALPISPLHEKNCTAIKMQSGEKINPFAALKKLKKG